MRAVTISCVALLAALGATGVATGTPERHLIQTAPIWIAIVLGIRKMPSVKWVALAYGLFWISMQAIVAIALLGAAGTRVALSPIELTLTVAIALASIVVIVSCMRFKSGISAIKAATLFIAAAALQVAAFLTSVSSSFAQR
jgi:hypothetical protein